MAALHGWLVIAGKSPDGDSIRFLPDDPSLLAGLRRGDRAKVNAEDGSVQLRLDGIDAPEISYGGFGQPLGREARDRMLMLAGFTELIRERGSDAVVSARPARVRGTALASVADGSGRPVALLFAGDEAADGVGASLAGRSLNHRLLAAGAVYPMLYDSLAPELRAALRSAAAGAREARHGVWAGDATTTGFELVDQASIGPQGALILPKLFRRCIEYLQARLPGQSLPEWLHASAATRRPDDDGVTVSGRRTTLAGLVAQRGTTVSLAADPLDLVFVEP